MMNGVVFSTCCVMIRLKIPVILEILTNGQGRKSMFKHGGDNIGEEYTSRLRNVLRGASRRAFIGGFGGMPPENFFKWYNLVHFGVYLDQILFLKVFLNYYFLYKIFINYHFFNKNFKSYYFLYKK